MSLLTENFVKNLQKFVNGFLHTNCVSFFWVFKIWISWVCLLKIVSSLCKKCGFFVTKIVVFSLLNCVICLALVFAQFFYKVMVFVCCFWPHKGLLVPCDSVFSHFLFVSWLFSGSFAWIFSEFLNVFLKKIVVVFATRTTSEYHTWASWREGVSTTMKVSLNLFLTNL